MDENNLIKYRYYFGCSSKRRKKKKKQEKRGRGEIMNTEFVFRRAWKCSLSARDSPRHYYHCFGIKIKMRVCETRAFFFFFLHNKNIKISYRTDLSIPFKKIVGNKRKRVQKFTDIGVPFDNFPCIPRVKYSMRLKYKRFTTRRDI